MFAISQLLRPRVLLIAGLVAVTPLSVRQVASAQTTAANEWTWMGGSTGDDIIPGVDSGLGVFASGNIPGDRNNAMSWTDSSGNFWFFGGWGSGTTRNWGHFNDLWEYKPSINEWAWISGIDALPCYSCGVSGVYTGNFQFPGGRQDGATWADTSGRIWLFGGGGYDVNNNMGSLNDLWVFDPSKTEWTWMGGSETNGQRGTYGTLGKPAAGNIPGGRGASLRWIDSNGHFWLFGGNGIDGSGKSGNLNDLWEYNPSTNQWAWMGGSKLSGQSGVYGTLGTPAPGNIPGGRSAGVSWIDSSGNLWLFGGSGIDAHGNDGNLNDLWEYNPSTKEWAWLGGSSTLPCSGCGPSGVYGTQGIPAPGGRNADLGWTDEDGNFWLFGGNGSDVNGKSGQLNDLWEFNPSTKEWAWMGGSSTNDQSGVYGTEGTPAAANTPGSRQAAVNWTDKSGNFWLFGGWWSNGGSFADLWRYEPANAPAATPTFSLTTGSYTAPQTVTISDATAGAAIYYTFTADGATPATTYTLYTGPIAIWSSGTFEAFATASGYFTSAAATTTYTITSPPAAAPTFSLAPGTYKVDAYVTLSDAMPGATIYYAINGAPTTNSTKYSGAIRVSSTETLEAIATANGYSVSPIATAAYTITPPPPSAPGKWAWMGGRSEVPDRGVESGVYGTLGTAAAKNIPGARMTAASWTDTSGNLWLFGGDGYDSVHDWDSSLNDMWEFSPTTREWTWMGGSSVVPVTGCASGVYGTLGVPAAANIPGGRSDASKWTDLSGHFWLFGGQGCDGGTGMGQLNDLWEFDPSTNEWTWISGSSTDPIPSGGRSGVYGTLGKPAAGNVPGGRYGAVSWTDLSGNLWLFGGSGNDVAGNFGYLNDLWKFTPATKKWAWMGGSSALDESTCKETYVSDITSGDCGRPGVYGSLGTPSAGNIPGGREYAATWTDSSGNFWLFGGYGFGAVQNWSVSVNHGTPFTVTTAVDGYLNDVWEFSPTTGKWSWMGGSSTFALHNSGSNGVYGTLRVPADGNIPAGRHCAARWTDSYGNLWLFGGWGIDYNGVLGTAGELNDLWKFNPSTNQWTWMEGSNSGGQSGVYGTLRTPALADTPGSRRGVSNANWTDAGGNLWLFGGYGYDDGKSPWDGDSGGPAYLNDLWRYQPPARGTQSITFTQPASPVRYGVKPITLSATASSGLAVTFSVVSGPATVSGSTLTITGVGTVVVAANQAGDSDHLAAAQVTRTITVEKAAQTITFKQPSSPVANGVKPITLSATATSGLVVTFSVVSGPAKVSGATLTITGAGTVVVAANQAGNADYSAATQVTRSITVAKAATTTVLTSSLNPSIFGQSVKLTAAVTGKFGGTATGTVKFNNGSTSLGSVTLSSSGKAVLTTTTLAAGTDTITAVYSGDANFVASTSNKVSQVVKGGATLTSPKQGTKFTSASQKFTWTAPTGATSYSLLVGSTEVGSGNLYYKNTTAGTLTANNLPVNGETLYVRLKTSFNGVVTYNDYTFIASTKK